MMIGAITASSPHCAPARLPIIQYAIVCIPSLLLAKYTIKLENAPHTADSAIPARSSFIEFDRPPRFEIKSTASEITKAPIKAAIPTKFGPSAAPTPRRIAEVAPSDAPEEIPRMYGSARGFFTIACMMTPQDASPAPTSAARTSRGRRRSHTISWTGPCPVASIGIPLVNW